MQQAGNHVAIGRQLAIAQQRQQVLARMRQFLQPRETEESRGSLDGVHGAEDVRQQPRVGRPRLQFGQAPLHPVQAFLAFDQELPRQFVHPTVHPAGHMPDAARRGTLTRVLSDKRDAT